MGHTYSNLLVHVIFSTKNRTPSITPPIRTRLYEYLGGVARKEFGRALTIGGTPDHLHALVSLNADVSIAEALRKWKSLSSGWVHKSFSDAQAFAWQAGYGAFSVSQSNVAAVRAYIARQEEHHRRVTFDEELRTFLERHGVPYDPDHLL
ncbi:MAG: IS200/IS605 family transposase [Planctomycetes bacterium]|nr:IS200/IS605 family transposase [Planctomycetota bacterium]